MAPVPLVAHVIHRLDVGGLENGLVNLVNRMPGDCYRHAIVCLTDYTDFSARIRNPQVTLHALHKPPGNHPGLYVKLWRLFRRLRPAIVHTRNLATLEAQLPALLAGVPHRVHGEHGRDGRDLDGTDVKYRLLRRTFRPLVHRYVALSEDLEEYLRVQIGVPVSKLTRVCNGVDTGLFQPGSPQSSRVQVLPADFAPPGTVVIGTVGRMEAVKDQLTLARAFVQLVNATPDGRSRLRLVMIGAGSLRAPVRAELEAAGLGETAWLPGNRENIAALLGALDIFVLPSLGEGISNTLLEAMACGLPSVATRVGGNSELVEAEQTGLLVPGGDPGAMAAMLRRYVDDPGLRIRHGTRARQRCIQHYSIDRMMSGYQALYDELTGAVASR